MQTGREVITQRSRTDMLSCLERHPTQPKGRSAVCLDSWMTGSLASQPAGKLSLRP